MGKRKVDEVVKVEKSEINMRTRVRGLENWNGETKREGFLGEEVT